MPAKRPSVVMVAILVACAVAVPWQASAASASSAMEVASVEMVPASSTGDHAGVTGFSDVNPHSVHAPAIGRLARAGIVRGVDEDIFDQGGQITREQIASIITSTIEVPAPTGSAAFADIGTSVHQAAIASLAEAGIVRGATVTHYRPSQDVTRGQLAALLVRIDEWNAGGATVELAAREQRPGDPQKEREVDGHTLEKEANLAYRLGYLDGSADGTLSLDKSLTRGQGATIIDRFRSRHDESWSNEKKTAIEDDEPTVDPIEDDEPTVDPIDGDDESVDEVGEESSTPTPGSATEISHGEELTIDFVGPQDGVSLASSGAVTTSRDGQIIEGMHVVAPDDISAAIVIRHDDVTVRNVKITSPGSTAGIRVEPDTSGTVIEHVEIDGRKAEYGTGRADANWGNEGIVAYSPFVAARNHIYDVRQGIQLWRTATSATIVENWIGEVWRNASGVSTSGISYRGSSSTSDLATIARNRIEGSSMSGIGISARSDAVVNVLVENNLIIGTTTSQGQTGYGLRGGYQGDYRNGNHDVRIEGNRFGGSFQWGTNGAVNPDQPGNTWAGNRLVGSTTDVAAKSSI